MVHVQYSLYIVHHNMITDHFPCLGLGNIMSWYGSLPSDCSITCHPISRVTSPFIVVSMLVRHARFVSWLLIHIIWIVWIGDIHSRSHLNALKIIWQCAYKYMNSSHTEPNKTYIWARVTHLSWGSVCIYLNGQILVHNPCLHFAIFIYNLRVS